MLCLGGTVMNGLGLANPASASARFWGLASARPSRAPIDGNLRGWRTNTFVAEQGCAGTAVCSGRRAHSSDPDFSADYTITMFGFDFRQGQPYRFTDPARFSFAHGGKDRHPFPVPLRVYDQTIQVLKSAVQSAKVEVAALKRRSCLRIAA
jgi:hypothetical protein